MDNNLFVSAVIFDMDGLMFDTERIAQTAWQNAAAQLGYDFSTSLYNRVIGGNHADVKRITHQFLDASVDFDELYQRKQTYFDAYCIQNGLPKKAGLNALLIYLEKNALPIAIASSSPRAHIQRNIINAGLSEHHFQLLLGGDDVNCGKPDPEIFLQAATQLKIPVENCLVLEDSNVGIQSAHAAGMIPLMIPDLIEPSQRSRDIAFRILPTLHEVIPLMEDLKKS